jgi:hypothetical protein
MDAKKFFEVRASENPLMTRKYNGVNEGWGEYMNAPPPIPANWPKDAKWVWHPRLMKYVKGLKEFNYIPNIRNWYNKQVTERQRRANTYRARSYNRSPSRNYSRRRSYRNPSRRSSRRRSYSRSPSTGRSYSRSPSTRRNYSRSPSTRRHR